MTRNGAPRTVTKDEFKAEVAAWAARMKVRPATVHVRPMTRKWGSCSSRGRVTYADDLLAEPYPFRKECIIHELLHLKVPNHSKLFKTLLKAYLAQDVEGQGR